MASKDIVAITYSEFDKIIGPQLKLWYPQDSFRRETFDSLSQYVIMDKEYCERIVMVELEEWYLLSWSSTVENPKYFRNSVTFSFSLILDKRVDVQVYGRALQKIANTFVALEIEHNFLSNPDTLKEIIPIFKQIYDRLTTSSLASFCHTFPNSVKAYFNISLFRVPDIAAPQVADHQVPILINSFIDMSQLPGDVSIKHLIMHIDGVSHIKKIAWEVEMDLNYVKKCLLLLQYHKALILSDMFKFSNIYKLVSDQSIELLSNAAIEQEMMMMVVNPHYLPAHMQTPSALATAPPPPAQFSQSTPSYALLCSAILSLITDLHPAHTLAHIVVKQKKKFADNVFKYYDLVRLLAYLQFKRIVVRVNEFPVYMGPVDGPVPGAGESPLAGLGGASDDVSVQGQSHDANETRFVRLTRKTTTIKSLHSTHSLHGAHSTHGAAHPPTLSPEMVLQHVIRHLSGSESLDNICCKYDLNHLDILNHPHVHIIYK